MVYRFKKDLYPKEAIIKASYFYTDDYFVSLDADHDYFLVNMEPKKNHVAQNVEKEFLNEVLAQTNRYLISTTTKNIRELIIGRALASTMIDNCDKGYVDDESISADNILVNWFDKYD
jgi:His-Xaa-Ser system protein HxsD